MKRQTNNAQSLNDEAIDFMITNLTRPQPPARLREDFYRALEEERITLLFMRLGGALAAVTAVILVGVVAHVFSDSETSLTPLPPTAHPTEPLATQTSQFTPSPLAVEANDPFYQLKSSLQYTDGRPPNPTKVLPVLREDFTAYIQGLPEGFETLSNGIELFNLQSTLSPYAPYGLVLKLEDVDADGERELLVGILPPAFIIETAENEALQITELPLPETLPLLETAPTRIDTGDFDGNGRPDIRIIYTNFDNPNHETETILVTYDGQQWLRQSTAPDS